MGRLLGIDYGQRRIGVALSDPCRIIASPLEMIPNSSDKEVLQRIRTLCKEHEVDGIVIGLPLNMDGTAGPIAEYVTAFAEKLRAATPLPVACWDERLSSKSAENALIEGGTRREKRKQLIDKIAAQIILQHYIDATTIITEEP
ncbi:MAG: Holliday junction resolvase RuvX [Spartobacteria bacterium]|nr:Holliday junction resolvase RuvX [Spartobacteria bacterium]